MAVLLGQAEWGLHPLIHTLLEVNLIQDIAGNKKSYGGLEPNACFPREGCFPAVTEESHSSLHSLLQNKKRPFSSKTIS